MKHLTLLFTILLFGAFAGLTPSTLNATWGKQGKGGHHKHHDWGKHHNKHHHGHWKAGHNRVVITQQDDGTWKAYVKGKETSVKVIFADYPQYTSLGVGQANSRFTMKMQPIHSKFTKICRKLSHS